MGIKRSAGDDREVGVLGKQSRGRRKRIGLVPAVIVRKTDVITLRNRHAFVARPRKSLRRTDVTNEEGGGKAVDKLVQPVVEVLIDDDDLEILMTLPHQRTE